MCILKCNRKCQSNVQIDFTTTLILYKGPCFGFPGGPVVKSLPANEGDTGSIPYLGRFHMPQGNEARVPQLLSALQQERSLQ